MRHLWIIGLLACGAAWAQPLPDRQMEPLPEPGDPARGRELAGALCRDCHVSPPGADASEREAPGRLPFPEGVPLPFEDIANTAGVTEPALLAWLFTSHPTMPDIVVSPQEARDLVAYILSLREQEL
ncbi:cytochrome c [Rubellimicrobium roseum]|uniref:Cytochrome c n=1 Tax=Rubellimicrobium roseum TaxID=687525 RepID=A0A5C4N7D0_9RHOB|nr:cytochrome c [Rubellimicrobium roseum]TNC63756.1 cytochrome c [Rubellimicrobium roseum]